MGLIVRFLKFLSNSYQRRVDGTHSTQVAYQVLQRGLRRWQESEELLNARELSLVQSCRNRLILSTEERELIENSEDAVSRRWLKHTQLGVTILTLLALIVVSAYAFYSVMPIGWEEEEGAVLVKEQERRQAGKATPIKINQPPHREPLSDDTPSSEPAPTEPQNPLPAAEATLPEATPPLLAPETKPAQIDETETEVVTESAPAPPPSPLEQAEERSAVVTPLITTAFGAVQIRKQNGKVGMADATGRFLLPPEYDDIQLFNRERGLFKIKKDGKEGLARAGGELLLYPFFEKVADYIQPEKLVIIVNDGKYGLYDENRREFSGGFDFVKVCCYAEGLLGVERDNGRWGFVDREGKALILSMYDGIEQPFRNGRAIVLKDGRKIKIDRNGNVFPL